MGRSIWFILALIIRVYTDDFQYQSLEIDVTLYNQVLYDKSSTYFIVNNVDKHGKYEVRISYPAVIPTDFFIEVSKSLPGGRYGSRKLSSVEQLQFVAEHKDYAIKVTAYRTGLPLDMERLKDPVLFNIIVNRLYFGCSYETWKIIIFGLILIGIIVKVASPLLHGFIERILVESNDNHLE